MGVKLFAICVTTILCVGYVAGEYCYNDVVGACSPVGLFHCFFYVNYCICFSYLMLYAFYRRRSPKL